jgi:hypothetical protein
LKVLIPLAITLLGSGCASAQHAQTKPQAGTHNARECDPDWDGALLGGAIGISPLVFSMFTAGEGDGVPLGFKIGFIGGIAGFWGGLAIDSRSCEEPT